MTQASGLFEFFARLLSNKNRDLFTVRLGVALLLNRIGLVGFVGQFVGFFVRSVVGLLMEDGVFFIDINIDAYREGEKLKEFEKEARAAYAKARAKIYDEDQKNEIRRQYLDLISRIGLVGNIPK